MTIDIISYTDAQFAELSEEQLLEVKSAQLKKNRLDVQLQEKKLNEKVRSLVGVCTVSSTLPSPRSSALSHVFTPGV